MSKPATKTVSILSYIKQTNDELYELVQEMCIGRIFTPRKGSSGITFLYPDKELVSKLREMQESNPEDAVEAVQALVLLDDISSIQEFAEKKSNIPTFHKKKLPIASIDGKKVVLKNGAEIVPDKMFMSIPDRGNVNVYTITKALVPLDGEAADLSSIKPKNKKTGNTNANLDRKQLFGAVFTKFMTTNRDPAMELIVSLYRWAVSKERRDLAELIASQCSYDTLATIYILLQPNKQGTKYISKEELETFAGDIMGDSDATIADFAAQPVFSYCADVADVYDGIIKMSEEKQDASRIIDARDALKESISKPTAVAMITKFYNEKVSTGIPARDNLSAAEKFAEAELRVLSALTQEDNPDPQELARRYLDCTLDKSYMCSDSQLVANANLGFYYSTVYTIARSDALLYMPAMGAIGSDTSEISTEDVISLHKTMKTINEDRRAKSQKFINKLRKSAA